MRGAKVYYRASGASSLSYIGRSDNKRESQWQSMELHIGYLRSLENSSRTQAACLKYLENWLINFYPERLDLVKQMQQRATELGGKLEVPRLSWKYSWIKSIFGWALARRAQVYLPRLKWSLVRSWDKALFRIANRGSFTNIAGS